MSSPISKDYTPPIDAFRWCKNGMMPDVRLVNQLVASNNRMHAYRKKAVFNVWDSSASTNGVKHRFHFRSGEGTQLLVFRYGVAPAFHAATTPLVTFTITPSGGSPASAYASFGSANYGTLTPDVIQWGKRAFSISPNIAYEVSVTTADEANLVALTAFEVGYHDLTTDVDGFIAPTSTYGQIDDAARQTMLLTLATAWKHNGAHLYNWSCNGTAATITGGTWTNPLDATTAVASTSAGVILGDALLEPYGRRSASTYMTLCAYGQVTGGAGTGEVRMFTDYGGASPTLCSVTGIGTTLQWYTSNQIFGAGNFAPDEFTKADLQHRMNGAGTLNLYAVSLYLYET